MPRFIAVAAALAAAITTSACSQQTASQPDTPVAAATPDLDQTIFLVGKTTQDNQKGAVTAIARKDIAKVAASAKARSDIALSRSLTVAGLLPVQLPDSGCAVGHATMQDTILKRGIRISDFAYGKEPHRYQVQAEYGCPALPENYPLDRANFSNTTLTVEFCGSGGADVGGCSRSALSFTASTGQTKMDFDGKSKDENGYVDISFMSRDGAAHIPAKNRSHRVFMNGDNNGNQTAFDQLLPIVSRTFQALPEITSDLYRPGDTPLFDHKPERPELWDWRLTALTPNSLTKK